MKINILPGRYILAVSGGVDSMVLLDLVAKMDGVEIIVAHFDHGIRKDSTLDAELVSIAAKKYKLIFELGQGFLGADASEEIARNARYKFLNEVKNKHKADTIITAHHQDDVIETAFINIIRGTGSKGLISLIANEHVIRPLLNYDKKTIIDYARSHKISWREDSTNTETKYLRNYVRKNATSKLNQKQRNEILSGIEIIRDNQEQKDQAIAKISDKIKSGSSVDRQLFAQLPGEVGAELVATWMREIGLNKFDKKTIDRINLLLRAAKPGTRHIINKSLEIVVGKTSAKFK